MLLIEKNSPPRDFITYIQQENAHFDDMPTDVKNNLRLALMKEQGYVCAYCMSPLCVDEQNKRVKIEHYRARTAENELEYMNLLAVCKGNEGEPQKKQNCDTKKGNQVLHINPQKQADIKTIGYDRNGHIISSSAEFQRDLDDVLNLNCEEGYLVENRKSALKAFQKMVLKKLAKRTATGEDWRNFAKSIRDDNGRYMPYAGIIKWYINKKLKQLAR